MSERLSERDIRIQKAETLRKLGINPYAQSRNKTHSIQGSSLDNAILIKTDTGYQAKYRNIEDIIAHSGTDFSIAGRLVLKRVSGKLTFGQIMDETGQIQIMWEHQSSKLTTAPNGKESELLGDSTKSFDYWFVDKMLDVGDIIGIKGEPFVTHKGELTLFVSEFQLLSKAVRPLGDKRHGIGEDNQETAYRQRYLDMIFNRPSLERMKLRSKFVRTLRNFYHENGFMELETPILGNSASGAAARPFVTHHNDFDQDMYLRISLECPQKMATVGMLERVFEIGKEFRNEGSDPSHIQEFTGCEHYATYWNYEDNMRFTEQMFDYLFANIPELNKKVQVVDKAGITKEVDFQTPWKRIDYIAQVKADSDIDVSEYGPEDEQTLRDLIKSKGFVWEGLDVQTTATMIDYLYKKVTRPKIVGPAFIYNYPKTMQPLARQSDANPNIVEQWQLLVNGWELIKAYSELVDPVQQQANFDEQADAVAAGDDEATKADDEFVLAMEYGMPPQSGWGMGIDRILAMLTEQTNTRDVVLFPMMKPEHNPNTPHTPTKADTTKIAVVLLNTQYPLEPWQQFNTVAHLTASFAAREGTSLLNHDHIKTMDHESIKLNIKSAIMIKTINSSDAIRGLIDTAHDAGCTTAEFTKEMITTTDDRKIIEITRGKNHDQIEYLGVLVYGDKKEVEALTKGYELWK